MTIATPRNLLILLVAIFVAVSVRIYLNHVFSLSLKHQLANLDLAKGQAQMLQEKFKTDDRFKQISFGQYTPYDGCLLVSGTIQTAEDIRYITNAIESMSCPIGRCYQLMSSDGLISFAWYDRGKDEPYWSKAKTN
ncbi:MAG TPA: hypothetical protein VMH87_05390 [Pseudomonadales bacterium]|nr:hypothetical protein [Pseudomonadales bacterium]